MLKGDLNDLQQLAVVSVIRQRESKEFDRDWRQFVLTAVAMHPENSESILKLLERYDPEDDEEFAKPLAEEEMEAYIPVQLRPEYRDILTDLQEFGVAIVDDEED